MVAPAFGFATLLLVLGREPGGFTTIGRDRCRDTVCSFPNGMSARDVDRLVFETKTRGSRLFFERDSVVFMVDVDDDEAEVVVKHVASNESEIGRFCNTYFDVRRRVEEIGGKFTDDRFPGAP